MKIANITLSTSLLLTCCLAGFGTAFNAAAAPKKVLVVTVTKGFRHDSIPVAERIIQDIGKRTGVFTVEFARVEPKEDTFKGDDGKPDGAKVDSAIRKVLMEKMNPEALKQYDAVVFANTTGELPIPDKDAFMQWIKSGKGFVGMHSATDTFHGYDPYIDMIGGLFKTHGAQVEVNAINQDKTCPACAHLGENFKVFDEIYLFQRFDASKVHGLLTLDKHPNDKTPGNYPIAWAKNYGKGRVFYTSLGHREDVWDPEWKDRRNPKEVAEAYQKHILGGIRWALGLEPSWNPKADKVVE